jgi:hypothetical protein
MYCHFPITVVIATAGERLDLLGRTLESLTQCDLPNNYRETVVIENGVPRGVRRIVSEFEGTLNARYMFLERANKSAALNAALNTLGSGLGVFYDDDIRVSTQGLASYAAMAAKHGPAHFFGGPTRCDYETEPPGWLIPGLPSSAKGWSLSGSETRRTLFLGFNWAAFVEDILAAGGFDTRFGPGSATGATGQETNMQQRLSANHARPIYVPDAPVWHYVPAHRANSRWGLERSYREGIARVQSGSGTRKRFLGWPGYVWLCLFRFCGNGALAVTCFSRDRRYRAFKHYQRWRGARHGLRLLLGDRADIDDIECGKHEA